MELNPDWEAAVDKIRAANDEEKLPRKLRDLLDADLEPDGIQALVDEIRQGAETLQSQIEELEQRVTDIEEAASVVEAFGEAVGTAVDALDEWENAEDRESKRDARQTLLDALGEIPAAFDGIQSDLSDLEVDEVDDDEPHDVGLLALRVDTNVFETRLEVDKDTFTVYRGDDPKRAQAVGWQLCEALSLPFGDHTQEA